MACNAEEKLKEIIVSCGESIEIKEINEDADLVRDFAFDSIRIIQLVMLLEREFDIEIDDDFLLQEKLSPYKNLVEILKIKMGEGEI